MYIFYDILQVKQNNIKQRALNLKNKFAKTDSILICYGTKEKSKKNSKEEYKRFVAIFDRNDMEKLISCYDTKFTKGFAQSIIGRTPNDNFQIEK